MAQSRNKAVIAGLTAALTLGSVTLPAMATTSNSTPMTDSDPDGMGVPLPGDYDKADYYEGSEGVTTFASVRSGSTLTPVALSDEMKYFTKYESGCNYDKGLSYGDGYNAMGYYQFDRRYSLLSFIQQVYSYNPTKYAMFQAVIAQRDTLSNPSYSMYDYTTRQLTAPAQILNEAWHAAYAADPAEFSALQDAYAYNNYYLPVQSSLLNTYGVDVRNRADCVKGLVWGMCNLFGQGGVQKFFKAANINNAMSDRELVTALCDTVVNRVAEWYPKQPQYHQGWQNRYKKEKAACLAYLDQHDAEQNAGGQEQGGDASNGGGAAQQSPGTGAPSEPSVGTPDNPSAGDQGTSGPSGGTSDSGSDNGGNTGGGSASDGNNGGSSSGSDAGTGESGDASTGDTSTGDGAGDSGSGDQGATPPMAARLPRTTSFPTTTRSTLPTMPGTIRMRARTRTHSLRLGAMTGRPIGMRARTRPAPGTVPRKRTRAILGWRTAPTTGRFVRSAVRRSTSLPTTLGSGALPSRLPRPKRAFASAPAIPAGRSYPRNTRPSLQRQRARNRPRVAPPRRACPARATSSRWSLWARRVSPWPAVPSSRSQKRARRGVASSVAQSSYSTLQFHPFRGGPPAKARGGFFLVPLRR